MIDNRGFQMILFRFLIEIAAGHGVDGITFLCRVSHLDASGAAAAFRRESI